MITGDIFVEFSLILVITILLAVIVRALKQPIIISYILAGILASPFVFNLVSSEDGFAPLAKIGISLLLFIVGLNLNPRVIKHVGKVALVVGLGQILFTFASGFGIAKLLGFSMLSSLYIALALSFSSTIIIMKLLSDREETETVHGKIATGFLIVQDFVHIIAIISLLTISSISGGTSIGSLFVGTLIKGGVVAVALIITSIYILPPVTKAIAKSQELLLLFSIGWAMLIASIFHYINFSIEVGALIAGVTLSLSPYKYEISSKTKPFRNFFLLIFFIWLGTQMEFIPLKEFIVPIILFSLLILIGTPIIVMILMGLLGYTKKNSFLTGLFVAQISEFSFIISALGVRLGHISSQDLTLIVAVGIITIAGSSYMVTYSRWLYRILSPYLKMFEREGRKVDEGKYHRDEDYDVILFGHNRIGYSLRKSFAKMKKKILIVDNNPDITLGLAKSGVDCRYGDAEDTELLDDLPLKGAKMIISTIPDLETSLLLIKKLKKINKKAIVIVVSHQIEDSLELYEAGATYVITPHFFGGEHTSHLLEKHGFDKGAFSKEGSRNANDLLKRKKEGHRDVLHERG